MTTLLSVVLCTHNPRPDVLGEALAALARQKALDSGGWELIVVDNASNPALHGSIDLSEFDAARIVREDRLGLTHARLRGLSEAAGAVLVFVDDDNVLDEDYLRSATAAMSRDQTLGAIGGKSIPRHAIAPPAWFDGLGIDLACRDLGERAQYASWEGVDREQRSYPVCAPIGAGLVVRRAVFAAYAAAVEQSPGRLGLGRRGVDLASGEDNDLVMTALEQGWRVAYLPELRLEHVIPAARLARDYLANYAYSSTRTWVRVLDVHGISPWRPIDPRSLGFRKARAYLSQRAWSGPAAYIRWRGACGQFDGRADLWRSRRGVD
ncbi:MAG: glycosyltransferase [Enhydrobacter sp.]|nr:glycosyltransferase [Enhydrobacter sp.]